MSKAFISVDLEGMPHVVIPGHLHLKGSLYKEAREITTKVTMIVAEELHNNGFEEVIIADSHGPMVNLLIDNLPDYVEVVRGSPRPLAMIAGMEGCDAALFLGYHSKYGTEKSTFDHTYSGASILQLEINGVAVSEFLLNAYAAGDMKIPVILVAGDARLCEEDAKHYTPWVERVPLKESLSRVAARSPSLNIIENELREGVYRAVTNFREEKVQPLIANKPVKVNLKFTASQYADAADLLPTIKRLGGLEVEYIAETVLEAYRVFELLVLAAGGTRAILDRQQ